MLIGFGRFVRRLSHIQRGLGRQWEDLFTDIREGQQDVLALLNEVIAEQALARSG